MNRAKENQIKNVFDLMLVGFNAAQLSVIENCVRSARARLASEIIKREDEKPALEEWFTPPGIIQAAVESVGKLSLKPSPQQVAKSTETYHHTILVSNAKRPFNYPSSIDMIKRAILQAEREILAPRSTNRPHHLLNFNLHPFLHHQPRRWVVCLVGREGKTFLFAGYEADDDPKFQGVGFKKIHIHGVAFNHTVEFNTCVLAEISKSDIRILHLDPSASHLRSLLISALVSVNNHFSTKRSELEGNSEALHMLDTHEAIIVEFIASIQRHLPK